MNRELAERTVKDFLNRFDKTYEPLLYYAALPLILTPELLHYLRHHFTPQVPFVAEVDLLLSEDIFQERTFEQYTMHSNIRNFLLAEARRKIDISKAAGLLMGYLRDLERSKAFISLNDLQAQAWSAMVYMDEYRGDAVEQIQDAFRRITHGKNISGMATTAEIERLAKLTEAFSEDLIDYPDIVEYARLARKFARDDADEQDLQKAKSLQLQDMPTALEVASIANPNLQNPNLQSLALKRVIRRLPAQSAYYASVLGAIVLAGGRHLPPSLEFVAGGIGVNILSNLIEEITRGEEVLDDDIRTRVEEAIQHSDIANLITKQDFLLDYARLIQRLDAQKEISEDVLTELRSGFEKVATAEQVDELKALISELTEQASPTNTQKSRIFISYARADDESFVEKLYNDLKDEFDVWWDRASMPNRGLTFLQEIRQAIDWSDRLLLVAGPQAFQSDYVRDEWQYAYQTHKGINIVLRQGNYTDLPEHLSQFDAVDFRDDANYAEHIETLKRQLSERLAPVATLYNVPALPAHYLEQPEALDSLRDLVISDVDKPTLISAEKRITILEGMGGIGKTVLATAFAHDRKVRFAFPDGIVWLTVGQSPSMYELYRAVGIAFGDDLSNYSDETTASQSAKQILADKKCLLILDDVWELPVGRAFRDLISGTSTRLLITTRDLKINNGLNVNSYRLQLLEKTQAVDYLRRWVGDDPDLEAVAEKSGYLLLALKLAGARMKKDGLSGAEYLEVFDRVSRLKSDQLASSQEDSLASSIDLSIADVFPNSDDRELYYALAAFEDNTSIPQDHVLYLWTQIRPDLDEFDLLETLNALVDLGLIERLSTDTRRIIILPDLLYSYVNEKLDPPRRKELVEIISQFGKQSDSSNDIEKSRAEEKPSLFIIYRRAVSSSFAQAIYQFLTQQGFDVFFDIHSIEAGVSFEQTILNQIATRDIILVVIGEGTFDRADNPSDWVRRELLEAYSIQKTIIPIIQENFSWNKLPDELEFLSKVNALQVKSEYFNAAMRKLIEQYLYLTPNNRSRMIDSYLAVLQNSGTLDVHMLNERSEEFDGREVQVAGEIISLRKLLTKTNEQMAVFVLRDWHESADTIEIIIFPRRWREFRELSDNEAILEEGEVVKVVGKFDASRETPLIICDSVSQNFASSDSESRSDNLSASSVNLSSYWNPGHTATWEDKHIIILGSTDEPLMLLQGHTGQVNGVLETSNGNLLSWSADRTMRFWDRNGALITVLEGHTDAINGVLEMSNGRLLSWSADHTLRLWSEHGEFIKVRGHSKALTKVEILEDGQIKLTDSSDTERIWSPDLEDPNFNEVETKTQLITPKLLEASWDTAPFSLRQEVRIGQSFADYTLYFNETPIAVVEARRLGTDLREAIEQAKRYASSLNLRMAFVTNGEEILQIDLIRNQETRLEKFPSAESIVFTEDTDVDLQGREEARNHTYLLGEVMQTSSEIESLLLKLLAQEGIESATNTRGLGRLWADIQRTSILIPETYTNKFERFRELRNQVAHSTAENLPTVEEMDETLQDIQQVVTFLQDQLDELSESSQVSTSPNIDAKDIALNDTILEKISTSSINLESVSTTGLGITTGLNEAFIIDGAQRAQLIGQDNSNAEIIKPLLRGQDIRDWKLDDPDLYVIYTDRDTDLTLYPGVEKHLEQYRQRLATRRNFDNSSWYQLTRSRNREELDTVPKITFPKVARKYIFSLDLVGYYPLDSVSYIIPARNVNPYYLLGILNSNVIRFWLQSHSRGSAVPQVSVTTLREISLPGIPLSEQSQLSTLAEDRIKTNNAGNITDVEQRINRIVYDFYQLSDVEVGFIEQALSDE